MITGSRITGSGKRVGWIIPLALLMGCSSGGSGGNQPAGPTVTTQSCTEDCGDVANGEAPRVLSLDSPVSLSLSQGERRVFEVPSGAEVSVISSSGEVVLLLVDEVSDINFDNLYSSSSLCESAWRVKEENCTAEGSDSDVYAVVDAYYDDATFSITATNDCSVEAVNRWAYRNMQDYYLYADRVPVVNLDSYTDTNDLVRDLRFEELDSFSGISDRETRTRFFEEGVGFGFGHDWQFDNENQVRLQYVYEDSPLGRAGFTRGDIAVSLNGESVADMPSARFSEIFGDVDNPLDTEWEIIKGDTGETRTATLRMAEYRINTVLSKNTFYTHPQIAGNVAYVAFRTFLETSKAELDEAIRQINANNATDLVLDLRYNGGGRSSVGRRLASQIGGSTLSGQTHTRHEFNSNYTHLDYEQEFFEALPDLNLNRLIVLTSNRTASASERLINSLRPYMEVVTLGSRTRGKPFRSGDKYYCGKALSAMESEGVNAAGVSVLGGIDADCYAEDDITRDFAFGTSNGTNIEGMLDTALDYAFSNNCQSVPLAKDSFAFSEALKSPPMTYEQQIYGDGY